MPSLIRALVVQLILFMKSWKKFFKNLFKTNTMDTDELEPIDMLTFITEELQERYRTAKDINAQAQVIHDFLRRWEADSALDVLRKQNYEIQKGKKTCRQLTVQY